MQRAKHRSVPRIDDPPRVKRGMSEATTTAIQGKLDHTGQEGS
jgi:hypothetical protein